MIVSRARTTNLKEGGPRLKCRGPMLLAPFTGALKLLASQKSGGPWPPRYPGGAGPDFSILLHRGFLIPFHILDPHLWKNTFECVDKAIKCGVCFLRTNTQKLP